ncbi:MAG: HD domain-containing phosphohydrolase [Pseudomonadota bacterium]
MPEIGLSRSVNQHYLDKVMDLAKVMDVAATEDIVDARGMKLVAKGTRISAALQERLIVHKLAKPLESSISVDGAVDANLIISTATRLIDTNAALGRILRATACNGASPLSLLSKMEFGHGMGMLLSITQRADLLEHSVMVALLASCMAKKLHLSDDEQMAAALAGLLHDIGELYIDPAYLAPGKRLLPHEWAHIVVHPRLGQMLVNELESYPLSVGRAVAEHHERFNGGGYPRQVVGNNISAPGQAVAVAEMISGVLTADHPLERAELALKIIPGEHPHDLVAVVSGALRAQFREEPVLAPEYFEGEGVQRLFWRISSTLETGQNLLDGPSAKSARTIDLLRQTMGRVKAIERAFIGTGLDVYLKTNHGMASDLAFEKAVATCEIQWRLRDIARDLALHTGTPDEKSVFAALITLLDDDATTSIKVAAASSPALAPAIHLPASFAGSQPLGA